MAWLSAHLFYTEPINVFLAKAIKPYLDTVIQSGIAERMFFIRYFERGKHIRLRFEGEDYVLNHILKPNMIEHFEAYFSMYPSERSDPSFHPDAPASQLWLPNNSLHFIDYEPELERYGGQYSLSICERLFHSSSTCVLASMTGAWQPTWSYQQAMGVAIKLHLAMVHAFGFDIEDAADFFTEVHAHWLPFAVARERATQTQYEVQLRMMADNYEQGFQEQKEGMLSYHAAFWEALIEEKEFEETYIDNWILECRRIGLEFRLAEAQGMIQPRPDVYRLKMQTEKGKELVDMWSFYADFVHLTNNRLGIDNEDESYLAYLIMRSLEEML